MAQIDDLIATYLNAVETEGKSVRTIKSYRDSLASFRLVGRRLGFPDAVGDHDVTHVYAFLAELRARRGRSGRATTTPIYQNHHHRTLGAFFSWCRRMGYLDAERTHVFARVPLARIERKAPRPFSEEEIERLLAGCDRSRMTGCRNYALLLFLLDNGVRSQECASVQLDEVDWERRRVLVHGKGAKQRWVGIGERTADALRDYVARFRGEQAGALFLGRHGEGMADGHSFYVLLGRLAKRAGVEKANPHRFRYSFATWAIASGARELDVQLLLGHSSPQMTQHYARAYDSEQAVAAHAAQRGFEVTHETVRAWEFRFAPLVSEQLRAKRRGRAGVSWYLDETYVKVGGRWCYLYRAIDHRGDLIDSMLSERRDKHAARRFLRRLVGVAAGKPARITTDLHPAYRRAIRWIIGRKAWHRTTQYLNNYTEQSHRGVKQRYYPMLGFGSFQSASRFCAAFDALRQYFRVRHRGEAHVPLAVERRLFLSYFPRSIARHLGAALDLPAAGVTHRPLLAEGEWPAEERGSRSPLRLGGEIVGYWVRTRSRAGPLAAHAAWRTDRRRPPPWCYGSAAAHARLRRCGRRGGSHEPPGRAILDNPARSGGTM